MKNILFYLNSIQTNGGSHCKFSSQKMIPFSLYFGLHLGSSNWLHTRQLTQSRAVTSALKLASMLNYNMGVRLQLLHGKPFGAGKTRIKNRVHWLWKWEEATNHALQAGRIWNTHKRTDVSEANHFLFYRIACKCQSGVETLRLFDPTKKPWKCEGVMNHMLRSLLPSQIKEITSEHEGRLWPLLRKWVVSGIKYSPEAGPHLINNPGNTATQWEGH